MDDTYTDTGTIIPRDHFALVFSRDGECQMLIPDKLTLKEDDLVPKSWLAASMLGIKFMRDPEWVNELAEEFKRAKQ